MRNSIHPLTGETMSERRNIFTSVEENIFLIKIDHTPINTLNMQTLSELESALDEFSANPSYKVAIISGGDKVVLVSGADITEASEMNASGNIRDFILRGQGLFRKILECSKPVIAAINGLALEAGWNWRWLAIYGSWVIAPNWPSLKLTLVSSRVGEEPRCSQKLSVLPRPGS
jgi:enoyl-CoA hydratase/carnithine racemase